VIDFVEGRCQVSVQDPCPLRVAFQRDIQCPDRVLAGPARPEPVGAGLEPGLPLRLQRILDPCLVAPVCQHRDPERALLPVCLGDVNAAHRHRLPAGDGAVHPHRHRHPGRGVQRDFPVDPGRAPPGIALGRLPHADQRVAPRPQHHLLQAPDLRPVTLPRRLEDPPPQPRYVPLMTAPVNGAPLTRVLRSAHQHRCPACPSARLPAASAFNGSPDCVSSLSGPASAGIRPVIHGPRPGGGRRAGRGFPLPFGRRPWLLSHPCPPGIPPLLRSAYRRSRAGP
jgi:hypothetical protein